MMDFEEAIRIIKDKLSQRRFQHSLQVAQVARDMARHYEVDEDRAYLTGLLHDYAKGIGADELLRIAVSNQLLEDEVERLVPDLLHAPVGAFLLRSELGIEDEGILHAVAVHTLGALRMSVLDKIIYLADMIEPGRDYPGLERLQCLSWQNLDQGMLYGLESTIRYCLDRKRVLHPRTVAVRNNYLSKLSSEPIL